MAVKTVLKMGHPVLRQIAEPVLEFNTPTLDALLQDMFDTMHSLNGAGLAAPQIGVSQRVVIFSVPGDLRYPEVETVPETILLNPEIFPGSDVMEEDWEGCLSVPGLRGRVPRHTEVTYPMLLWARINMVRPLSDMSAAFTPGWCNMRSITWMACYTHNG